MDGLYHSYLNSAMKWGRMEIQECNRQYTLKNLSNILSNRKIEGLRIMEE